MAALPGGFFVDDGVRYAGGTKQGNSSTYLK